MVPIVRARTHPPHILTPHTHTLHTHIHAYSSYHRNSQHAPHIPLLPQPTHIPLVPEPTHILHTYSTHTPRTTAALCALHTYPTMMKQVEKYIYFSLYIYIYIYISSCFLISFSIYFQFSIDLTADFPILIFLIFRTGYS